MPRSGFQTTSSRTFLASCLFGASLMVSFGADPPSDAIPKEHPMTRYVRIWENSPFELEAPPPTTAAPRASFAENLVLVGVTKVGGKMVVTLLDRKNGSSFDVHEDRPSRNIRLVNVSLDRDPKATQVRLAQGSQIATVGYDQKLLVAAPKRPVVPQLPPKPVTLPSPGAPPNQSVLNRSSDLPQPSVSRRRLPAAGSGNATGTSASGIPLIPATPPSTTVPPGNPRQPPTSGERRQTAAPGQP